MWKRILESLKAWALNTVLPWLKSQWFQIINLIVIWIAFVSSKGFLHFFIGAWFWVMIGYYIGWKLLGIEKLFQKKV